jgi:hypothetical protein
MNSLKVSQNMQFLNSNSLNSNSIFYQDQLGSADVSQNDYDQILMGDNSSDVVGIGTLRTIDQKKEELRARNRVYQRRYRERKKETKQLVKI